MSQGKATATVQAESFHDVLGSLVGKVVMMASSHSLEDADNGQQITPGVYPARIIGIGKDYVEATTEYVHRREEKAKESVRQFIPLARIKRISVMTQDIYLHI